MGFFNGMTVGMSLVAIFINREPLIVFVVMIGIALFLQNMEMKT